MDKLALIMAAGEGTRMISETPKIMHQVCGLPMVEHVLRALDAVCKQQVMIVGHGKERVMDAYRGRVEYVEQTRDGWGTGHAIRCCTPNLEGKKGVVLVAAGDMPLVQSETFARLMREVEQGGYCAAVLTDQVDNPTGYGRVVREGGKVAAIVEQRDLVGDQQKIREINSSVYCFDIESLLWALPQLTHSNNANEYYLTDVIHILYQSGRGITTVPVLDRSECMGINNRLQLATAEIEMRRRINTAHMLSGVTIIDPERVSIQPDVTIGKDTLIHPGCEIGRGTIIGAECQLLANCQIAQSSLGSRCVIGNSLIKHSKIGNNVTMEHAVVKNAAIPAGTNIPPFTYIDEKVNNDGGAGNE